MAAVRVEQGQPGEVVLVRYTDGRLIAWHLLRECREIYAVDYHGAERTLSASIAADSAYYPATLDAIVRMGETGKPPIPFEYGVEVVGLLDAVERSRASGAWEKLAALS
jgi:predicted dehydrogenase